MPGILRAALQCAGTLAASPAACALSGAWRHASRPLTGVFGAPAKRQYAASGIKFPRIFKWIRQTQPPVARMDDHVDTYHGVERVDEYRWLQNRNRSDVREYIDKENKYGRYMMRDTKRLRHELEKEMKAVQERLEPPLIPERVGRFLYYARMHEAGGMFPVHVRRRILDVDKWQALPVMTRARLCMQDLLSDTDAADHVEIGSGSDLAGELLGTEQVYFDPNLLAERFPYVHIGVCKLSPDHRVVAYTMDTTGDENFSLYVRQIGLSANVDGTVDLLVASRVQNVEWLCDDALIYTVCDSTMRPYAAYLHRKDVSSATASASSASSSSSQASRDELLYSEADSRSAVDVGKTKDGRYVTLNANSKSMSEVHVLRTPSSVDELDAPGATTPICVRPRYPGVQYFVEHNDDHFYMVANTDGAQNFKVLRFHERELAASDGTGVLAAVETVVDDRAHIKIEDIDMMQRFLISYEKNKGSPQITVVPLHEPAKQWLVPLPSASGVVEPALNQNFADDVLRFSFSSVVTPPTVYDYECSQRSLFNLHDALPKGWNQTGNSMQTAASVPHHPLPQSPHHEYVCTRLSATSADGTEVPLTVAHRRSLRMDGSNPAILFGYGAYGSPLETWYDAAYFPLLERGWVLGFAHVRGGGELGQHWYNAGKLMNKTNSFTDFLSCGTALVDAGYTSRSRLAAHGFSAGGLLVAAAACSDPAAFAAIVLRAPFVDVLSTMLDPELPLTAMEYGEWGNPRESLQQYRYVAAYDPYEQLARVAAATAAGGHRFPHILVSASTNDIRVPYWGPVKFVARARRLLNSGESASARAADSVDDGVARDIDGGVARPQVPPTTVLLQVSSIGGHYGAGDAHAQHRQAAFEYAFLYKTMGLAY